MTREEAIKDIQYSILPVVGGKSLRMAISALRQPEIIHCKDCKHYSKHKENYMCGLNVLAYVREVDYCSRAERREDGQTDFTASWLEAVIGITYGYFDNNYSGNAMQELYDEYDYYCDHPEEYADYFKEEE